MVTFWQDNEVRFDIPTSQMQMAPGETALERVEQVEDSKANSGEYGCLLFTNMRLIWYSSKTTKLNLTVGYNTLSTISSQSINPKKKSAREGLYLLSKTSNGKFEFLFTPLNGQSRVNLSNLLTDIHRSYVSSKPFRELRLRHHMIHTGQLKVLPLEHVCNRVEGVWNLASNQGNLGCFIVTNVRLVWFASMNEYFNISLPYLQITQISLRDSKFGEVLVLESAENSGGYVLGFRIDPAPRLMLVFQEIQSLYLTQIRNPELGIVWNSSSASKEDEGAIATLPQSGKGSEGGEEAIQCIANYWAGNDTTVLANCNDQDAHPPNFDRDLGLAMEQLPEGLDRKSLWQIIF